jgi:hypothetical protein
MQKPIDILEKLNFGSSVAEDETGYLQQYFVNTRFWRQVAEGRYDIVLGAKGSGKSAIYLSLINQSGAFLKDRNIVLVEAANPRGDTVFALLNTATRNNNYENPGKEALIEEDVVDFWKLYFLTIMVSKLRTINFKGKHYQVIESLLENAGLLPKTFSISDAFQNVLYAVRQIFSLQFFQPEVEVNPTTGTFTVKGKINFEKYSGKDRKEGYNTTDELLDKIDQDLKAADNTVWLLLDRLDVAFIDDKEIERRALKSLFLVYNSLKRFENIQCKIFLRDDIMLKITYDGLREASHLEKMTNLLVDERVVFNILIRRLLNNAVLLEHYGVKESDYRDDIEQQRVLFNRIFPEHLPSEGKEVPAFNWIIEYISDGNDAFTPREMIQLMNEAREAQIELLELGHKLPDGKLFSAEAFQRAIRKVSKAKFERTLLAENPDMTENFLRFRNAQPIITADWLRENLKDINGNLFDYVDTYAIKLADIGFFKKIAKDQWKIPYLYQYALRIDQEF